jgi:hypothetical protein
MNQTPKKNQDKVHENGGSIRHPNSSDVSILTACRSPLHKLCREIADVSHNSIEIRSSTLVIKDGLLKQLQLFNCIFQWRFSGSSFSFRA